MRLPLSHKCTCPRLVRLFCVPAYACCGCVRALVCACVRSCVRACAFICCAQRSTTAPSPTSGPQARAEALQRLAGIYAAAKSTNPDPYSWREAFAAAASGSSR